MSKNNHNEYQLRTHNQNKRRTMWEEYLWRKKKEKRLRSEWKRKTKERNCTQPNRHGSWSTESKYPDTYLHRGILVFWASKWLFRSGHLGTINRQGNDSPVVASHDFLLYHSLTSLSLFSLSPFSPNDFPNDHDKSG